MIDPGLLFVCFPPQKNAGLRGQVHAQYAVACVDWQKQSVRKCVFLLPCARRYKGGIRSETAAVRAQKTFELHSGRSAGAGDICTVINRNMVDVDQHNKCLPSGSGRSCRGPVLCILFVSRFSAGKPCVGQHTICVRKAEQRSLVSLNREAKAERPVFRYENINKP